MEKIGIHEGVAPSPLNSQQLSELADMVAAAGLFLEEVKTKKAGRVICLEVVVDLPEGPGQVGSEQLTEITRQISAWLDEVDPIADEYVLEVGTPGITRPLETTRQYSRALGYKIEITTLDKQKYQGKLAKVTAEEVELETEGGTVSFDRKQIRRARMVVEF